MVHPCYCRSMCCSSIYCSGEIWTGGMDVHVRSVFVTFLILRRVLRPYREGPRWCFFAARYACFVAASCHRRGPLYFCSAAGGKKKSYTGEDEAGNSAGEKSPNKANVARIYLDLDPSMNRCWHALRLVIRVVQDSSYIVQISQPGIVPIVRVPPRAQHELDTGCLEACRPKSLQSSMSTPFLRDKTLKFAHAFIEPLPSLLRKRFFFFPHQIFGVLFFFGIFGSWGISYFRRKPSPPFHS